MEKSKIDNCLSKMKGVLRHVKINSVDLQHEISKYRGDKYLIENPKK